MNKKNLSVVLAGAMLATSVAPVLAATEKEYSVDNKALLEKEILNTMNTKMLTTNKALIGEGNAATPFLEEAVAKLLVANKDGDKKISAYGIRILDEKGNKVDLNKLNSTDFTTADTYVTYNVDKVNAALKNIKEGYTVELVERATSEFYGELVPGTKIEKGTEVIKYDNKTDFEAAPIASTGATYKEIVVGTLGSAKGNNVLLDSSQNTTLSTEGTGDDKVLLVKTNKPKDLANPSGDKVLIKLAGGDQRIDGRLPLTSDEKLLDYTKASDIAKFDHFDTLTSWTASKEIKDEPTVTATYKMTAAAKEENTVKAEELYDGVVLTAKGTELAAELANAKENAASADEALVKIGAVSKGAVNKFSIYYYKNATEAKKDTNIDGKEDPSNTNVVAYKSITVYSSNADEIDALHAFLSPSGASSYKVGIVGGDNRYETAVNVAKEQGVTLDTTNNKNIVLVNGSSLVDGLSAAPLAATINGSANAAAPVLLTKADSLPKETKEYIESLLPAKLSDKKQITVTLVGGRTVLSNSLVNELEEMGVTVRRLGGDNRETTSIAVAKEIKKSGNNNAAFIVGGNGEADAMAISAVAATQEAPIIVSSVHGLSEDGLEYLKERSAKGDVTIVGGESVVSEAEETAINESLTLNKASRIAGVNRFETNAKIIEKYYKSLGTDETNSAANNKGVKAIIVTKDGQSDKGELVDALSAANYAAANNAPIVLATNSLSAVQKNALLKVDKTEGTGSAVVNSLGKAVQVGEGVERSVLEAVAGLFGLSNK